LDVYSHKIRETTHSISNFSELINYLQRKIIDALFHSKQTRFEFRYFLKQKEIYIKITRRFGKLGHKLDFRQCLLLLGLMKTMTGAVEPK
jgi:hypothetical protein